MIKSQPLAIHKELSEHLAKSATEAGLKVKKLPSGAGHDTVIFGNLGIPAAMIFVANQKGSHNPNEAMEITDFIQGRRGSVACRQRIPDRRHPLISY